MTHQLHKAISAPMLPPFAKLMSKLGESFIVRDVMVPLATIDFVPPGDEVAAQQLVRNRRYSVVPVSRDRRHFEAVYLTGHELDGNRIVTELRQTSVSDHIPDATPLAEAFFLFEEREWYLALRENRVSGLITYWAFNSREFRVQLYASLSRVEELSRDVLARDGCGDHDRQGLKLSNEVLAEADEQFKQTRKQLGGNRFVDELQFHHIGDALRKHTPWRDFLDERCGKKISSSKYEDLYTFTKLRDAVMHGRVVFPTYELFKSRKASVEQAVDLIDHLEAYLGRVGK